MSGDGDSRKPKDDVLASIRKIMRGGSADLGPVPAPGSKAGEGAATEPEDDWSLPPGALSEAEGGAPSASPTPAPSAEEPGAAEPDVDDDDDDDDFLPLSSAMQVAPAASSAAPAEPAADEDADADTDDGDDAIDLSTISAGANSDDLMIEDDVQVIREDTGAPVPIPDWESATAEAGASADSAEDTDDVPGQDDGADPFASLRKRWDWPADQPEAQDDELPEISQPMSADDDTDEMPEVAAVQAQDTVAQQDDAGDWDDEPALTLGEIEDTIRRVVREELEGETGQRLSQNIRRLVLNEIARAMQRTD